MYNNDIIIISQLFYTDNLQLVEPGNDKFARAIYSGVWEQLGVLGNLLRQQMKSTNFAQFQ